MKFMKKNPGGVPEEILYSMPGNFWWSSKKKNYGEILRRISEKNLSRFRKKSQRFFLVGFLKENPKQSDGYG